MTAIAEAPASRARGSSTRLAIAVALGLFVSCIPAPARAQVGATASVFSDFRFRGYSLSSGNPVAILDIAYDDSSGLYAEAAATGVLDNGDPAALGLQLGGGYAKRLGSGTTLDFGISQATYAHYSKGQSRRTYGEIYAGVTRGAVSSRIFFSPHYSEAGLWTAYGEINGNISPARHWSIDGHVGMLVPLRTPGRPDEHYRTAFDGRLGLSRELGRLSLHLSLNEGARGREFYGGRKYGRTGIVLGATWGF